MASSGLFISTKDRLGDSQGWNGEPTPFDVVQKGQEEAEKSWRLQ